VAFRFDIGDILSVAAIDGFMSKVLIWFNFCLGCVAVSSDSGGGKLSFCLSWYLFKKDR
jgi:hypothetical protein